MDEQTHEEMDVLDWLEDRDGGANMRARMVVARIIQQRDELLAACEGLLSIEQSVTQGQERERRAEWVPRAKAAIANAKGGV